jgi:hypothetical protein
MSETWAKLWDVAAKAADRGFVACAKLTVELVVDPATEEAVAIATAFGGLLLVRVTDELLKLPSGMAAASATEPVMFAAAEENAPAGPGTPAVALALAIGLGPVVVGDTMTVGVVPLAWA